MLKELFVYKEVVYKEDIDRIVYNDKYILAPEGTTERALYELVSDIARDSGMSFDFSYRIMDKACSIVADYLMDSDGDDDDIFELVDNAVPVYNHELMAIYQNDWEIVDEANEELGGEGDSVAHAQRAWYYVIERMVSEVRDAVQTHNNNV